MLTNSNSSSGKTSIITQILRTAFSGLFSAEFWIKAVSEVLQDMARVMLQALGAKITYYAKGGQNPDKPQQNGPSSAFNSSASYGQPEYRSRPAGFPTQKDDSLFNNHSFGPR